MNPREFLAACRRERILKIIKDEFNGLVPLQKDIIRRMREETKSNRTIRHDLESLVTSGHLTIEKASCDRWGITYRLAKGGG